MVHYLPHSPTSFLISSLWARLFRSELLPSGTFLVLLSLVWDTISPLPPSDPGQVDSFLLSLALDTLPPHDSFSKPCKLVLLLILLKLPSPIFTTRTLTESRGFRNSRQKKKKKKKTPNFPCPLRVYNEIGDVSNKQKGNRHFYSAMSSMRCSQGIYVIRERGQNGLEHQRKLLREGSDSSRP